MAGIQYSNVAFHAPRILKCKFCAGWTTTSFEEMLYHVGTHRNEWPKPRLVCKYSCGFRSTEMDAIRSHELSSHKRKHFLKGDQLYFCDDCELYALGKDKLASHMREFHNKAKLDSNITDATAAAAAVATHELKYGTKLYHCRHCDMFALKKHKLVAHKHEMHNKKLPKKKISSRCTTSTRGLKSTINQGAASENGQFGAASSGEVGKEDNVELTSHSEDSMDYDLSDNERFPKKYYNEGGDDDDDEYNLPHDELYGPVF